MTGVQILAGAESVSSPPIQWVAGNLLPGGKQQWREADYSPPPSIEPKNAWRYTSIPQYAFMAWCFVKKEITWKTLPLS
jgi:hypothetical protein